MTGDGDRALSLQAITFQSAPEFERRRIAHGFIEDLLSEWRQASAEPDDWQATHLAEAIEEFRNGLYQGVLDSVVLARVPEDGRPQFAARGRSSGTPDTETLFHCLVLVGT